MEVATALASWDGEADAWFLDGFAPAKNPDMWRREVINLVAAVYFARFSNPNNDTQSEIISESEPVLATAIYRADSVVPAICSAFGII